jgi:hypothetical protein
MTIDIEFVDWSTYSGASDVVTFAAGDTVAVFSMQGVKQGEGTVVRYHRGGAWVVRESMHGTTCCYYNTQITTI